MGLEQNILVSINKAKAGDMQAFEELIIQHETIVYHIACQIMNHSEDAKDVSQEVFIKIYKNLKNFDGKSTFSTWIYRITVNTCIDEMRKRKGKETVSMESKSEEITVQKQFESADATPEECLIAKEETASIQEAMSKLSEEHSTILTLRDLEGFSYDEMAEILSISIGTVKSRLARARTQLKREFTNNREQNENIIRLSKRKEGTSHGL